MKKLATVLSALVLVFSFISCATDNVTEVLIDWYDEYLVIGKPIQLPVIIMPSDAVDKSISWKSSDTTLATVDSSGKVTALAEGSVEITATASNGVFDVILFQITSPLTLVELSDGSYEITSCHKDVVNVQIPDNVSKIGDYAFLSCLYLESIAIPESITSIGSGAFSGCSSLTSIALPERVTSIGNWAFHSTGLKSITIPESVTSMGKYVFFDCPNLTSIFCEAAYQPEGWDPDWLGNTSETIVQWGYTGD